MPDKKFSFTPFPYFGGKRKIAPIVWQFLGDVQGYTEPFFGGGSVLLTRPHKPNVETVNDINGHLVNVWRSIARFPKDTAEHAYGPVSEIDARAKHKACRERLADLRSLLESDPKACDPELAGWWVYGSCAMIGQDWSSATTRNSVPYLTTHGQGIHANPKSRSKIEFISDWFRSLALRLERVRICSGDWSRLCTEGALGSTNIKNRGIFLDPPYGKELHQVKYQCSGRDVTADVREWCKEHGDDKRFKIILCGLGNEHSELEQLGWSSVPWITQGGFSNVSGSRNENAMSERLWVSPHCLKVPGYNDQG